MSRSNRKPVYEALDKMPDSVFAALLFAMFGVNRLFALTLLDDPTPSTELEDAIKPFMASLGPVV